jgi:ribonucleoside-diphosphate reductase alpha chain
MGELQGTIAELQAPSSSALKKALFEPRRRTCSVARKRSRPDVLRGTTIRKETPLGTMFVNITEDEKGQPFEVFINLGKAGGSRHGRRRGDGPPDLAGAALGHPDHGDPPSAARHLVRSRRGPGPEQGALVPDAIGIALEQWWREKQGVQQDLLRWHGGAGGECTASVDGAGARGADDASAGGRRRAADGV